MIRCYGTVYGMEIPWVTLLRCLLVAGVLGGLLLPPRRGTEIVLCLSAVVLGYLLRLPQTLSQLKSLLVYASVSLHEVYHWGYFIFPGHTPGTVEIPVAVYGSAVLLSFARCVIRRRGPVLPLLLTVPVLDPLCADPQCGAQILGCICHSGDPGPARSLPPAPERTAPFRGEC